MPCSKYMLSKRRFKERIRSIAACFTLSFVFLSYCLLLSGLMIKSAFPGRKECGCASSFSESYHQPEMRKMRTQTLLQSIFAISSVFVGVRSTVSPKNDDRDWLTLATGSSSGVQEVQASSARHQSSSSHVQQHHQQHPQEAPMQQASTMTQRNEDNMPNKKPCKSTLPRGRGQYTRTYETIEKHRAYWTPEKRMKQRETSRRLRIGKVLSEESKKDMKPKKTGRIVSDATREKMRKAHLGHKPSEATIQKIRETKKRTREQRERKSDKQPPDKEAKG
ncbi:uncharacterized protein FA14DRAFT_56326 [Meira miltonrushii]|uniref:Nuclease associated modular domain-containing protein n=1 Tax=Meira miltonrushii TaxID=1280837 RepID=A0A316V6M1_9BASI|nr:uncharacterized protein FA14DRAFT_56326 [Meira miltonrushii]PWN33166.1 hypothetical protein FA14DRAFT_56326 [Meira miltonrushii]